jgi:plastocyanin
MGNRRGGRLAMWCASTAICGALVVGGAGVSGASTAKPAVKTAAVSIINYSFMPKKLTVAVNTKVTWTNNDSTGHNVISTTSGVPFGRTKPFPEGKSYSYKFTTPGTYTYYCSIHTYMKGTIIVTQKKTS